MEVSLKIWGDANFNPPPTITTLRNWAKAGNIRPMPRKVGRIIMVQENAQYIDKVERDYEIIHEDPVVMDILNS